MNVHESSDSRSSSAMTACASRLALSTRETIDRSCVVFIKVRFNVPEGGVRLQGHLKLAVGKMEASAILQAEPCFVLLDRYEFTGPVTTGFSRCPLTYRRGSRSARAAKQREPVEESRPAAAQCGRRNRPGWSR